MIDAQFIRATLVLPVQDMNDARGWYERILGFETVYLNTDSDEDPDGNYAILKRDGAEVHLILDDSPREHPWSTAGTGYMFLTVQGVDAVFEHVQQRGASITRGIITEAWGARAFQLTDPSGNLILVAEAV